MHYKFTGKERDSESGLDYFGARYYASNVGRWISADWAQKPEAVPYSKLDDPQSLNLYEYGGNNPITQADLDGHQSCNCYTGAPNLGLGVTPSQANAAIGQIASFFKPIVDSLAGIRISGSPLGPIVTFNGDAAANTETATAPAPPVAAPLPANPDDLKNQGYVDTSHPEAAAAGHREFTNPQTGDRVRHDAAKPGAPGHAGEDHYHRYNPNSTGKGDKYLDANGKPVADGSDASHLKPAPPAPPPPPPSETKE